MGEVVELFPDLPRDLKVGDPIWLSRYQEFGKILRIRPTGHAEIALRGRTVELNLIRDRNEVHTPGEPAYSAADVSRA